MFVIVPRAKNRAVTLECVSDDARGLPELVIAHPDGRGRLLLGNGTTSGGERFEGRLGFVSETEGQRRVLGMDVACWKDVSGDVPFRLVRGLVWAV